MNQVSPQAAQLLGSLFLQKWLPAPHLSPHLSPCLFLLTRTLPRLLSPRFCFYPPLCEFAFLHESPKKTQKDTQQPLPSACSKSNMRNSSAPVAPDRRIACRPGADRQSAGFAVVACPVARNLQPLGAGRGCGPKRGGLGLFPHSSCSHAGIFNIWAPGFLVSGSDSSSRSDKTLGRLSETSTRTRSICPHYPSGSGAHSRRSHQRGSLHGGLVRGRQPRGRHRTTDVSAGSGMRRRLASKWGWGVGNFLHSRQRSTCTVAWSCYVLLTTAYWLFAVSCFCVSAVGYLDTLDAKLLLKLRAVGCSGAS